MGSSSLGKWNGKWIKDNFPEAYRDLCTSFIDRGFSLSNDQGYSAMVTMQSWMFLGSYEKLRGKLLRNHTISSMAHLGTRAFGAIGGEVVSTTATVFANKKHDVPGTYLRLVDMQSEEAKREGALEALANPDCEWLYRCLPEYFNGIPGTPIAYWASKSEVNAFKHTALGEVLTTREGMATADNDRFLRYWHEVAFHGIGFGCKTSAEALKTKLTWFPYQKGGEFRKWYGNNDFIVNWANDGFDIRNNIDPKTKRIRSHNYNGEYGFRESATWSALSSSAIHVRYAPYGSLFDSKGAKGFADTTEQVLYAIALINSSAAKQFLKFLAPTLDFKVGDIAKLPNPEKRTREIAAIAEACVSITKEDYDDFEESWDFRRHPLL